MFTLSPLPPGPLAACSSLSAVQWTLLTSGDPPSQNVHHHRHLAPHCQRCWVLALMLIYAALVFPSISTHCSPAWRAGECYPYSPSGHSRKSMPQCQLQSMTPCSANGNSLPVIPCQCYLVTCLPPPSFPPEVMLRESQPRGTLCYIVATGFLHLVEPQALLPTRYLANYANYTTDYPVLTVR